MLRATRAWLETQSTNTRGGKQSLALIDINTPEKDNNGSKRLSSTLSVSNRKHLLWVFFVYQATLSEKKFHLRPSPTPCPLSKSQCLEKECILDMVPENAHYQQHGCSYFPFKSLLWCGDDRSLPLVEKICVSMGLWTTNRLRVDKVWTSGCFSVQPLLCIIVSEWQGSHNNSQTKTTKSINSHHKTQEYIKKCLLTMCLKSSNFVALSLHSKQDRGQTRAKKWKTGEGEEKEGNTCRQTPWFWKPAFAGEPDWLG